MAPIRWGLGGGPTFGITILYFAPTLVNSEQAALIVPFEKRGAAVESLVNFLHWPLVTLDGRAFCSEHLVFAALGHTCTALCAEIIVLDLIAGHSELRKRPDNKAQNTELIAH